MVPKGRRRGRRKKLVSVLEYGRDTGADVEVIIRQAYQMGRPVPESIQNAPELLPGLHIFLKAFYDLDTERQQGAHMPGPIPYSQVVRYGRRLGYGPDDLEYFLEVIRAVDDWHLGQIAKKLKSDAKKSPSASKGSKWRGR